MDLELSVSWIFEVSSSDIIEKRLKPLPPADGHPVSPTMMGNDLAPILSNATLQPLSMASNKEPCLPKARLSGMSDDGA